MERILKTMKIHRIANEEGDALKVGPPNVRRIKVLDQ